MPPGGLNIRGRATDGAVVRIAKVLVAVVVVALRVIELGLKLQLLSDGKPEHRDGVRLMVPANALCAVNVSTVDPEPPGRDIVIVAGLTEIVKGDRRLTVSVSELEEER
jgi:hypothetical protein